MIATIIFAINFVAVSFDTVLSVEGYQLRVMANTLDTSQQKVEVFQDQTPENTKRIIGLLRRYQYLKLLNATASKAYTDGMLVFMIFYNNETISTMQIISDGNIIISSAEGNRSYLAIGGGKLFHELYDLIEWE
ncbi:hypothetical protein SDC9_61438 [bioreactor metagenome]|uniref:Uncharacterized protein n=1 Tax=bioreactor metagenome TaxID=1076179 RepID=A0A644XFS5_9ZZZZ